jgi:glycerate 2-kinase
MFRSPIVVIAPDSFKGSVSAPDAAAAIGRGIARVWPEVELRICPMADGGEGTLDAILARGGERRSCVVTGAAGTRVDAAYGWMNDGAIVVIEAAQVVGLTDAAGTAVDAEQRSTRGVGELIRAALDAGVRRLMIGVGGSSTNDGGAGMLAALGLSLVDAKGQPVAPTPEGLASLAAVDTHALDPRLGEAAITIMSDVNNPLCGERGATAIFGPQKGVRRERIAELDARLARFAALAERAVGRTVSTLPGAGAAGGLGFALQLIGGEMRSGAQVVADLVGLDAALTGADWLITGEGRSDLQTLLGKTPWIVAQRAAAKNVPATLLSGGIDGDALPELAQHFAGCFALPAGPGALADCVANAATLLADRAEQIARLFDAARANSPTRSK